MKTLIFICDCLYWFFKALSEVFNSLGEIARLFETRKK